MQVSQQFKDAFQHAVETYDKSDEAFLNLRPLLRQLFNENLKRFFWEPNEEVWNNFIVRMLSSINKYKKNETSKISAFSYLSTVTKCFMTYERIQEQKKQQKTINVRL